MWIVWTLSGILGGALLLFLVYLFLIAPGKSRGAEKYAGVTFAHRGLWGDAPEGFLCENTLSAFRRAAAAGFGIELDTRLSKDGVVVVHHDDTLMRLAGIDARVDAFTAEELKNMNLRDTGEGIPTFAEVLEAVGGRVPLLVEIKEDAGVSEVTEKTCELLKNYTGPYIIESFNPFSVENAKKRLPDAACGLLCDRFTKNPEYRAARYRVLESLILNVRCRPSFLALEKKTAKFLPFRLCALFGVPRFAWTVRSEEEERSAKADGFDGVISERYLPFEKKQNDKE